MSTPKTTELQWKLNLLDLMLFFKVSLNPYKGRAQQIFDFCPYFHWQRRTRLQIHTTSLYFNL